VVIAVARRVVNSDGTSLGYHLLLWCPGCDQLHVIDYTGPDGVVPKVCWEWDGNLTAPTISPSLLYTWTSGPERVEHVCHSHIVAGSWQFLADCTHTLRGQTVPLPALPTWVTRE
jgi:hypothetical protein